MSGLFDFAVQRIIPALLENMSGNAGDYIENNSGYAFGSQDQALINVRSKDGSVTVILGTRETGKTVLAYRFCEFLGRPTYAVSPEQRPPSWVTPVKFGDTLSALIIPPWSTVVYDDLPAYMSNRDYNESIIEDMERLIPMVRHDRKLHLVYCSQSAAQADKYILDCDLAFLKPLGLLTEERPHVRRIYRKYVDPVFDGKSESWIKRHAFMYNRHWSGIIDISPAAR